MLVVLVFDEVFFVLSGALVFEPFSPRVVPPLVALVALPEVSFPLALDRSRGAIR